MTDNEYINDEEMIEFKRIYTKIHNLVACKKNLSRIAAIGFSIRSSDTTFCIITDDLGHYSDHRITTDSLGKREWEKQQARELIERRSLYKKLKEEFGDSDV